MHINTNLSIISWKVGNSAPEWKNETSNIAANILNIENPDFIILQDIDAPETRIEVSKEKIIYEKNLSDTAGKLNRNNMAMQYFYPHSIVYNKFKFTYLTDLSTNDHYLIADFKMISINKIVRVASLFVGSTKGNLLKTFLDDIHQKDSQNVIISLVGVHFDEATSLKSEDFKLIKKFGFKELSSCKPKVFEQISKTNFIFARLENTQAGYIDKNVEFDFDQKLRFHSLVEKQISCPHFSKIDISYIPTCQTLTGNTIEEFNIKSPIIFLLDIAERKKTLLEVDSHFMLNGNIENCFILLNSNYFEEPKRAFEQKDVVVADSHEKNSKGDTRLAIINISKQFDRFLFVENFFKNKSLEKDHLVVTAFFTKSCLYTLGYPKNEQIKELLQQKGLKYTSRNGLSVSNRPFN